MLDVSPHILVTSRECFEGRARCSEFTSDTRSPLLRYKNQLQSGFEDYEL